MPQRSDKWKALFADLGRPTKRGIRKCHKCGTVNGTRGNSCKNKACDVVFRDNGASKKTSTEACKVSISIPGLQIFSVRLRDRGPDYRNFVQLPLPQSALTVADEDHLTASYIAKCYVDSCVKSKEFPCGHIEAAQRCFSESQPLNVKHSILSTLNIPGDQQQTLSVYINETSDVLVQRVSKTSFIVKCAVSAKHPFGYLHIMFYKHNKEDGSADRKFLCTCKPFKVQSRDNESSQSGDNADLGSKLCIHYHACLCAFASDDNLIVEFDYFLSQANQDCTPTLLSQLHLVTLPQSSGTTTVAGMDTNHISVEIMQENISLLESIAAAEDATLQNVQELEGVLSDQIIVTNVDDSLSFADATGLEGLDDGDSQVCQIFASAQNAIQLANAFSNSENIQQTVNIASAVLTASGIKKRRQVSGNGGVETTTQSGHHSQPLTVTNHYENKPLLPKGVTNKGFQNTSIACSTATTYISPQHQHMLTQFESQNLYVEGFETWLSGVNERLNAAMNYQFTGRPDPVVYYISCVILQEYFECLKERITSGVKKKRLPNQTVIISRTDRPPAGTFTKYVWKITNIIHVLQIFQNQIIPLKMNQYFIKGANGVYEEWIQPNETDRKNQLIKPHMHSTFLKVGKSDLNAADNVPFIIEWIPDILPQSKLGELSLIFEFGRDGPIDESFSNSDAKTVQQM